MTGAVGEAPWFHRPPTERLEQPQGVEFSHCVGQEVDAHPERARLAHALEHIDPRPDFVQTQRGGEAADARADHNDPMPVSGHAQRTSWTEIRTEPCRRSPVDTARRSFIHASRDADVESLTWVRK